MKPTLDLDKAREVFERFVIRSEGCWGWKGKSMRNGYPYMKVGWPYVFSLRSSRAAWMIFRGPIPDGMVVCHTCDTPACSNPDHLFIGTQAENVKDMLNKGRSIHQTNPKGAWLPRGDKHGMSKLTEENVKEIRRLAECGDRKEIAKQFSISLSYVYHLVRKRTWAHV